MFNSVTIHIDTKVLRTKKIDAFKLELLNTKIAGFKVLGKSCICRTQIYIWMVRHFTQRKTKVCHNRLWICPYMVKERELSLRKGMSHHSSAA